MRILVLLTLLVLVGCSSPTYTVWKETELMENTDPETRSDGATSSMPGSRRTGEVKREKIEAKLDRAACELVAENHNKREQERFDTIAKMDHDMVRLGGATKVAEWHRKDPNRYAIGKFVCKKD